MKKKEAKELDAILSVFTPNAWIAKASEEEMPACYKLADLGMIEILNRESRMIRLTEKGAAFRAKGGFVEELREKRAQGGVSRASLLVNVVNFIRSLF